MSLVILCPGQGGQHPGMFARVQAHAESRDLLALAEQLLGAPVADVAGRPGRFRNAVAQPLVCAGALAHWLALQRQLPPPVVVAGYSAGELAAHAVAGSFDAMTCLQLAVSRAAAMDAASPADGALLALLGLDRAAIDSLCSAHGAAVAIVNGPDHFVLGGHRAMLQQVQAAAEARGARSVEIPVCVPAHTPMLAAATQAFTAVLADAGVHAPQRRLLAGIDGHSVVSAGRVVDSLGAQISQTVQWQAVMDQAVEYGGRVFLELGPGSALSRRARALHPRLQARSVEDFQTLEGVVEWVAAACARA